MVGYFRNPSDGLSHGFFFSDGENTDLNTTFGGLEIKPNALNDAGQIVGYTAKNGQFGYGFLLTGGVLTNLNDLSFILPANTSFYRADFINNSGQIVATGVSGDTYLLSPLTAPEPASYVLVLTGAVLLAGSRARRTIF